MRQRGFEGWYLKHQKGAQMLALIPGRAESGAFVQMISPLGSRQFRVPGLVTDGREIRAGKCRFSPAGCTIDLPGVRGSLSYGALLPLQRDIMGPFRFLPMECRHGVLSMGHPIRGQISIDGRILDFDGGLGYIEKDSGISFPASYLWLQCNTFPEPASLMVSVADIPFWGLSFPGCICAIVHGGMEYRFATYLGVRIRALGPEHLCLTQGPFRLEVRMVPASDGHPLAAPRNGHMCETIRECCNAHIQMTLWQRERQLFHLSSPYGTMEYVPGPALQRFHP